MEWRSTVTVFQRSLIVWAVLVALFLLLVMGLGKFGARMVDKVGSRDVYKRGQELLAAKEYDEAVKSFSKVLDVNPGDADARFRLVESLLLLGRFNEAVAQCDQLMAHVSNVDRVRALLLQARACRATGQWGKARDALKQVVQVKPNCAEGYYGLAEIAQDTEQFPEMATMLKRVAEVGPAGSSDEYVAFHGAARQTIEELDRRIESGERTAEAYYNLGIACLHVGQWDKAIEALAHAADAPDGPADASFWLGVNAELHKDIQAAISHYENAVERCPTHVQALRRLLRIGSGPKPS